MIRSKTIGYSVLFSANMTIFCYSSSLWLAEDYRLRTDSRINTTNGRTRNKNAAQRQARAAFTEVK